MVSPEIAAIRAAGWPFRVITCGPFFFRLRSTRPGRFESSREERKVTLMAGVSDKCRTLSNRTAPRHSDHPRGDSVALHGRTSIRNQTHHDGLLSPPSLRIPEAVPALSIPHPK